MKKWRRKEEWKEKQKLEEEDKERRDLSREESEIERLSKEEREMLTLLRACVFAAKNRMWHNNTARNIDFKHCVTINN